MNKAILTGRLTKDPDMRYLPEGTAVTKFTLAVDKEMSNQKKQEAQDAGLPTADFINVTCWGQTAEFAGNYLYKGQKIGVEGRIESRSWKADDGSARYATEIRAQNIEPQEWKKDKEAEQQDMTGFHKTAEKAPWE